MKTILIATLLLNVVKCTDSTTVYICTSPNAMRYHLRQDCRGLRDCNLRITKITLEDAKASHRTLCKWEKR